MPAPSIEKLREKKNLVQQKRAIVAKGLGDIEQELKETFCDMEIFAAGRDVTLETEGLDDYVYGHLTFGTDGLAVAYRATDEDFLDHINGVPEEERGYKMRHFSTCKTGWLERLSSSAAVESLFANIENRLDQLNSSADESLELLKNVLEHQAVELNQDAEAALSLTASQTLSRDWTKARGLISIEPAESITRSSSYLESVCKYILVDMGAPIPPQDTISNLIGACLQRLPLSSDERAGELMKQLVGNFRGIFNSIGAIRNNYATAHGAVPGNFEVGEHEARLVNNAAASASVFLLHRHAVWRNSVGKVG